jgi:Predicted membrane protein
MDKEAKLAEKAAKEAEKAAKKAEKETRGAEKEAQKEKEKEQKEQEKTDEILAGKAHVKAKEIHQYGLIFLERNGFTIGQTVDINYNLGFGDAPRFFAIDSEKKRFYQDPWPLLMGKYDFHIYDIDKITNISIIALQRKKEQQSGNYIRTVIERCVGLNVLMNGPRILKVLIMCLPYAQVGDSTYQMHYKRAEQIQFLLKDAMTQGHNADQTAQQVPKPAFCKGCGAPIEGTTDACSYCGSPLK